MSNCLSLEQLEALALPDGEESSSSTPTHIAANEHIAICPACRRELDEIREDIEMFAACRRARLDPVPQGSSEQGLPVTLTRGLATGLERPGLERVRLENRDPAIPKISGYEILAEIHRGAQGVVYKAIQLTTKRTVALKVLLHGPYASHRQKLRFEREIELVAALQHPNIVTLHESGQADSRHYFAMQYIDGLSLRDHAAANRMSPDATLRLFGKICRAVAHAHQRGIIHRDLKPSNIRVDRDDEPYVLDFGLAKPTEVMRGFDSLATHTGEFFGTLAYASPEQVSGDPGLLDTRTDIYALGVILYELLTSRAPYRTTGSMPEILRNINEVEPEKPSRHNRSLNDELDRLVLKALAKDPQRRYQSTDALADDVERYLAGRPIEAKADSGWYVLKKNMIRYRIALGVAAAFALVIFAGLMVSLWQWSVARTNAEVAQNNSNLAAANFQRARNAVDQMLTEVAQESLQDIPQMTPVRRALLEKALAFYEELIQEGSDDISVRLETARAYSRIGDICRILGQLDRSREAGERAIAFFENLRSDFPSSTEHKRGLAAALMQQGILLKNEIEDLPQALKNYQRAFELRAKLLTGSPASVEYQRDLAASYTELGNVLYELGKYEEAVTQLRQSLAIRKQLAADDPEDRWPLAHTHHWLGAVLMKMNRLRETEEHFRTCLALREEVIAGSGGSPRQHADVAHIQLYLGLLLIRTGKADEAADAFNQSIAIEEKLVAEFPSVPEYRKHLGVNYERLGEVLLSRGRMDEAEQAMRNGIRHGQYLVSRFPESSLYRKGLAWMRYNLGAQLHRSGKIDEAYSQFNEAFAQFDELVTKFPDNPRGYDHFSWALLTCPDRRHHDPERAIALSKKAVELKPNSKGYRQTLGLAYYRAGHWQDALTAFKQAPEDGFTWFVLAMAQSKLGNQHEARLLFDQAVTWMEKNSSLDSDLQNLRSEAAELLELPTDLFTEAQAARN